MRDGDKLQTNSRSQEDTRTTEELDGDQTGAGREEEEEEEEKRLTFAVSDSDDVSHGNVEGLCFVTYNVTCKAVPKEKDPTEGAVGAERAITLNNHPSANATPRFLKHTTGRTTQPLHI